MASSQANDMFNSFVFPQLRTVASELLRGVDKDMSDILRGYDNTNIDTDIAKTASGYEVYADLPGVKKEDVQVYINENGFLVISAKRSKPCETMIQSRRRYGACKAEVSLPSDADSEKCSSSLKEGVLVISIPLKTENVRRWVPVA